RDEGARILTAPDFTKHADRLRHRELLTGKAGYEPAAADFAARLQPAKDAEHIAPRRQPIRLALEQAPEHDAAAPQRRARRVLDRLRRHWCAPLRRSAPGERPSPRVLDAEERRAPPAAGAGDRLALLGGNEQRAQSGEAVGIDEAERHELGERLLDLRAQQ